eukprot:403370854
MISLVIYICLFIGLIKFGQIIFGIIGIIQKFILRKPRNHYQCYGISQDTKNISWAVVTGGSDGIGLAFCHHLAKSGFNICIIGRTQSKIQEKLVEIKQTNPSIQTDYVIADFFKYDKIEDYQLIVKKLHGKDIGMFIINAGWAEPGRFDKAENKDFQNMLNINALHVIYLTQAILPTLLSRSKRSAILVTSSVAGQILTPGNLPYNIAKRFASIFTMGLSYEVKDKIDMLSFEPIGVSTNLMKEKPNLLVNTAEYASYCALRDLGNGDINTIGSFIHNQQYFFAKNILGGWSKPLFYKLFTEIHPRMTKKFEEQRLKESKLKN